ncbi:MAG: ImmA/IrrE family metallo-endopeptidase [Verrucomicrobia bacterium]|nr:ImmA/IrrE family metallo-endopeptidase [Verrucomicrobiota bacterium]
MVGERIRLARARKGYSLERLAREIGVTRQAVSKYELGRSTPSSGILIRMANALGVSLAFLLRARTASLESVEFRRRSRLPEKQKGVILAQTREWVERYLDVEEIARPEASGNRRSPSLPRMQVQSYDDVERAAAELRRRWQLGLDPIESVTDLLEDRGIKVLPVEGHEAFDALTLTADGQPVIAVKHGIPGDRQRLSLAHELGHLVLDVPQELKAEKAAYRFAGAFLVPEEVARRELGRSDRSRISLGELLVLKQKYGMSVQAWICRVRDLGILNECRTARAFRILKAHGWHEKEPGEPIPPESPKRLAFLVMRALAEDLVTESRAAELLGESIPDLRKRVGIAA